MACEDCDWPVEGKMSHIVDSVYMYSVFKVTYIVKCTCTCMVHYHTGHMMKLFFSRVGENTCTCFTTSNWLSGLCIHVTYFI